MIAAAMVGAFAAACLLAYGLGANVVLVALAGTVLLYASVAFAYLCGFHDGDNYPKVRP